MNRTTVSNAYEALAADGLVRSHVGQGTFVRSSRKEPARERYQWSFSRAVDQSLHRAHPPVATDHPDPIDFASLVPDEELFPVESFREVLNDVLSREGKTLLQYGPSEGHPPLRRYIAERLSQHGVRVEAGHVLIVNGSQQGLDLVCRAMLDPGDVVAVESPTYTILPPLLAQYRARIVGVPMTTNGIDTTALFETFRAHSPKLLFTMPTFHNPTGTTMTLETRQELLSLAAEYRVPVVEDDFDSELRLDGEDLPSLKVLDTHQQVIHIGTFSKGLFPGLRLGWVVAPREVVETIGRAKMFSDYHTSLLLQAAVLSFCLQGHYDEHLKRLVRIYRRKSKTLREALDAHLSDEVSWTEPQGGFAHWLRLPATLDAEALLAEATDDGVVFTPGNHFFARRAGSRFLRLSISRVPLGRIEEGVERLGRAIRRRMKSASGRGETDTRADHEPAFHI